MKTYSCSEDVCFYTQDEMLSARKTENFLTAILSGKFSVKDRSPIRDSTKDGQKSMPMLALCASGKEKSAEPAQIARTIFAWLLPVDRSHENRLRCHAQKPGVVARVRETPGPC
jgi:hypothetical protein